MQDQVLRQAPSLPRVLWQAWATHSKRPGCVEALPPARWSMPHVTVQAATLAHYRSVCGFEEGHGVPLTYPQLLTFPLVMAYLCSPACPWPAAGTVHLANRLEQFVALQAGDVVDVELVTAGLRSHAKGQVFDLDLVIRREGALVWRGTQSLLRRGVHEPAGLPYVSGLDSDVSWRRAFEFEAPGNIGRRYARVSGDFNPMHLSRLSARLLGFRRTIAHGLWTQARALAGVLPARPVQAAALTTEFKSPVMLPARLAVWQHDTPAGMGLEVRDAQSERTHVRALLAQ